MPPRPFIDNVQFAFPPEQDRPGWPGGFPYRFGSAHSAGFFMAFCDGSVRSISYDIAYNVFGLMGGRDDEFTVPQSE
jgi:hypothetical protein